MSISTCMAALVAVVAMPAALIRLKPAGTPDGTFVDNSTVTYHLVALVRPARPGVTRQGTAHPAVPLIAVCGGT